MFSLNVVIICLAAGYGTNYGNADAGYAGNPYSSSYGLNSVSFHFVYYFCFRLYEYTAMCRTYPLCLLLLL